MIIRVRFIIGCEGVSHRLRGSTRMWVRRMLKKSVRIRGIFGRTSSQAASVIIRVRFIIGCEGVSHRLRGSTRMWVRRMLKKSVRIRGICGRTSSQAASVKICGICGKTFSQAASEISMLITGCEGVSHRLRGSTRMWVRRMLKKSVRIRGIFGRTSSQAASVIIRVRFIIGCEGVSH